MTTSGRLEYDRRCHYNPKVKVGTWYEDGTHYVQNKYNHVTSYDVHYVPMPYSKHSEDIIWNNIIRNDGFGPRILIDHERNKYHHNFSTTYDISYNHMPKWSFTKKFKKRYSTKLQMVVPQQDFTVNYGNLTDYGIREYKKEEWQQSKFDRLASTYQDDYLAPDIKDYTFKRRAADKDKSSSMVPANSTLYNLPLRGQRVAIPFDFHLKEPKKLHCPLILTAPP